MLDKQESDDALVKIIMRKAYIVHAALAFDEEGDEKIGKKAGKVENDKPAERSFFAVYARVAETQHKRYLEEFSNWNFYDNIKVDPLESKEPDEKVVLADNVVNGIQRQSTQHMAA